MHSVSSPSKGEIRHERSTSSSSLTTLLICAIGICTSYLYYGMLQEELFASSSKNNMHVGATFLLTSQSFSNNVIALVLTRIWPHQEEGKEGPVRRLNHPLLIATSLCYVVAMTCTNESLQYVSYPMAVLFKSSKLIPTMVLGSLVEKRLYTAMEWGAALLITCGVAMFHLYNQNSNQTKEEESSSMYGILLLSLSLVMDGFLGACQGLLKSSSDTAHRPPTAMETMLFCNFYAACMWWPYSMWTGSWQRGVEILWSTEDVQARNSLWMGMMGLNATAAMGQVFIFCTITWYSSLMCTTITTTRKFFTILLSVIHFGHIFSWAQWAAVAMVFLGLYTSLAAVASKRKDASSGDTTTMPPATASATKKMD